MSILDLLHVVAFFTLGMWLVYGVAFPDTDPYYGDLSLEPNARSIYPAYVLPYGLFDGSHDVC